MLGWITVHWRAQKQQWLHKKTREESSQDNIYSTMCPVTEVTQQAFEIFFLYSFSMTKNMIKKHYPHSDPLPHPFLFRLQLLRPTRPNSRQLSPRRRTG